MADKNSKDEGAGLGTFAGVFTPSVLTILGIILFLRMGYVVGAAGLVRAMVIILMANMISVLTSVSLSAIATNLRVKGGGDYYLISRTLGVEYGGALGIVLFLAQSVSIAFYCIGFGEALSGILGSSWSLLPQVIAACAVSALFLLAWLGSDWATKFQYVVMVVLFSAIVAFFAGGIPGWDPDTFRSNLWPAVVNNDTGTVGQLPFWFVFAVFFPAVTGFTQGVSMSGDLKNPGKSLPRGTFLAVFLSMFVYISVAVIFAGSLSAMDLVADNGSRAMRQVSRFAWLIDAGVIAATLSSALASFLGAPRILQSLAGDRVFPFLNPFAVGSGPTNNPRRGVLLSAGIAFATIALGRLNVIAPVVSMFFLISYGLLNYATYFEAQANSPSFRPRFRFFHARLSLLGSLACLGAMLAIQPTAGAIAVAVLFALYRYVAHGTSEDRWADSSRSRRLQRVRENLHAISADMAHPRDWRPVLVVLTENPERRVRMLRFASWLEGGAGFTTAIRLISSSGLRSRRDQEEADRELRAEIAKHKLQAFAKVVVTDDAVAALPVLLQSHGLGRVKTNTMMLNWFDGHPGEGDAPGMRQYARYLRSGLRSGSNVIILGAGEKDFRRIEETKRSKRRIDVWYRDNATGRLMLLLAYLMTRSQEWENAKLRLLVPVSSGQDPEETLASITKMLEDVRIDAEPRMIDEATPTAMVRESLEASVTFLPFRLDKDGPASVFGTSLEELVQPLGLTVLVLATQDIVLDSDPEAGRHGEFTEAVDAFRKAEKLARQTEKDAQRSLEQAEKARAKLTAAQLPGAKDNVFSELEQQVVDTEAEIEKTKRRAARARGKADVLRAEAEKLLGRPLEKENGES